LHEVFSGVPTLADTCLGSWEGRFPRQPGKKLPLYFSGRYYTNARVKPSVFQLEPGVFIFKKLDLCYFKVG